MAADVAHVLLTRINVPAPGQESGPADDDRLRRTVAQLDRLTVPSVQAQTCREFSWVVYLHPDSPAWLRLWAEEHRRAGLFRPRLRAEVTADGLRTDLAPIRRWAAMLLTTDLEPGVALARDAVARVQGAAPPIGRAALHLTEGLLLRGEQLYRGRGPAVVSVAEPWPDARTCWPDPQAPPRRLADLRLGGGPGWLRVAEGRRWARRVDPAPHREAFPGLLGDSAVPRSPAAQRSVGSATTQDRPRGVGQDARVQSQ